MAGIGDLDGFVSAPVQAKIPITPVENLPPSEGEQAALLCFQNQARLTTAQGGRFFNPNYADFCTGADKRSEASFLRLLNRSPNYACYITPESNREP